MLEADPRFLRNRNHFCNSCTHWFISDIFNILIKSKVFRLTKTLFFKIWLRCDIFLSSKTRKRFILVMKVKHVRTFRLRLGFVILKLTQNPICGEEIDSFQFLVVEAMTFIRPFHVLYLCQLRFVIETGICDNSS